MAAVAAFGHYGLMKAGSKVVGKLVNLVIAVNFDGFFCGIHYHVAFLAPMEVFVQLSPQAVADPPIEVIGQLL